VELDLVTEWAALFLMVALAEMVEFLVLVAHLVAELQEA
jgi:hypothetical protein